jgi:hypothetical protein
MQKPECHVLGVCSSVWSQMVLQPVPVLLLLSLLKLLQLLQLLCYSDALIRYHYD